MSENKKLELLDQYDDVTFALLMDEYAEEEGARLRKEFEEAQAAGEVSDTSDALDEKCLQMIHRDFAKKRGKDNVRKFIRMTSKVAAAVMMFLGVATATIFSVDALRIPVLNYFLEHQSNHTSIHFSDNDVTSPPVQKSLADLLPEGYVELYYDDMGDGEIFCAYQDENGDIVKYSTTHAEGNHSFDSEDTGYERIIINSHDGFLIQKDGIHIIWLDPDSELVHSLFATTFPEKELIDIANLLALGVS